MSQKKKRSEAFAWIRALTLSVLIVILVRTFILGNYIVDGPSMKPTLYNGDRLIVNKLNYEFAQPQRFDVVIFHATKTDDYVKRVIGLPGDTIQYKNDQLYVNGKAVAEPFLDKEKRSMLVGQLTWDFSLKELTGKTRVPEGMLWVMGDNRQNSTDSRVPEIGFISEKKVVGKVDLRYWPLNRFGIIHRD
ncbi:signal peptidase I [Sporolactobacillus terrae]|uniref:Signal peptidase I n=1 Tax=Sporolactobacillus terrae TaxID=269673 RepID=A0A410DAI6_9BACL|nr:signal peptidase I [Sporolactobacillus terrae]QAA23140.1 signal peptidase I [Sporolactobacillus terrae]QAA26110.1 signal peptidase I [Sporolactobacillus terrae]UAK15204.1 signal peptidase I [Sporolactobacillus terrae]BBN99557.1 signal peptidase I [Sporolactobacillus terrae]